MDINELIKHTHRQWLVTKEQRRQKCVANNMEEVARKLAACALFTGKENVAELARVFTSPQGIEFCLAANFPSLATLRMFRHCRPEQYGVYIDAGDITLHNPATTILIGRTTATIHCGQCKNCTIVAMHGATATVLASGWAVVRTEAGRNCNITSKAYDNAIIL